MKPKCILIPVFGVAMSAHAQVSVTDVSRVLSSSASITTTDGTDTRSNNGAGILPGAWEQVVVASVASDSGPFSHGHVTGFASQNSFVLPYSYIGNLSTGLSAGGVGFSYAVSAGSSLGVTFITTRPLGWISRTSSVGMPGICEGTLVRNDTMASTTVGFFDNGTIVDGVSYTYSTGCEMEQSGKIDILGFNTSGSRQSSFVLFADECASAIELWGPGPFPFDNAAASSSAPDEAACDAAGFTSFGHDVWYRWRSTCPGSIRVSTCGGTAIDSKIAVYVDGCPGGSGTLRGCNDDACDSLESTIRTYSLQGRDYLIRVGTYPLATGGEGTFTIACCPCDFDGTGIIDSSDFFAYLTAFLAGFSDADYNGDILVNTEDFFDFVRCYFSTPAGCD